MAFHIAERNLKYSTRSLNSDGWLRKWKVENVDMIDYIEPWQTTLPFNFIFWTLITGGTLLTLINSLNFRRTTLLPTLLYEWNCGYIVHWWERYLKIWKLISHHHKVWNLNKSYLKSWVSSVVSCKCRVEFEKLGCTSPQKIGTFYA